MSVDDLVTISFTGRTISGRSSLQYRMAPAFAMVGRLRVSPPVVVIKDEVFALVANDVGDSVEIFCVLGDDEGHRTERDDHPGRINVTALVIIGARVLGGSDRYVRRVLTGSILISIRICYEDRVIGIIQPA